MTQIAKYRLLKSFSGGNSVMHSPFLIVRANTLTVMFDQLGVMPGRRRKMHYVCVSLDHVNPLHVALVHCQSYLPGTMSSSKINKGNTQPNGIGQALLSKYGGITSTSLKLMDPAG